jgi:hypothetical protein
MMMMPDVSDFHGTGPQLPDWVKKPLVKDLIDATGTGDVARNLLCGPYRRWPTPTVRVDAERLVATLPFPILRP